MEASDAHLFVNDIGDEHAARLGQTLQSCREHGVLRRALLVYVESVPKIRANPGSLPTDGIARTAKLFRSFGEDYHERMLEEPYIFPAVKKRAALAQRMSMC